MDAALSHTGKPACDVLTGQYCDDLHRLASRLLCREQQGHPLSPTDLVHETYARLVNQTRVAWRGRAHFLAIAAQMMRRILVDQARRDRRVRRGGDWKRVTLEDAATTRHEALELADAIALDDALAKLASIDPREAQIVELRFFVGLSNEEIAEHLGVATRSVGRDWAHAKVWLRRELAPQASVDNAA
jgi:RNA polymerase sigma factor (TIGR02999 family)